MSKTASSTPAVRRQRLRRFLAVAALAALAVTAWAGWWGFRWYHLKRFAVVDEGAIYRSGQPTELGLGWLIGHYHVKTILSLRPDNPRLHRGWFDAWEPDGSGEREFLARAGVRQVQWPMADEACWPWFTPWQFEEFFKLFDDPANLPVAVHCVGGRHRTGTAAALYRLEYDGWPADRAVPEMLSFRYGFPVPLCDLNLRTYRPRPRPSAAEWDALQAAFLPLLAGYAPADYAGLALWLSRSSRKPKVVDRLRQFIDGGEPFSLPLAQRLIDSPKHPLAELAARRAAACLERDSAAAHDWFASAALVADFGTIDQQRRLLAILENEPKSGMPSARYQEIAAGVMNRYTPNRMAYLRPLLVDRRRLPDTGASSYRYCDAATGHVAAIANVDFLNFTYDWEGGLLKARQWFTCHEHQARLSPLLPPAGNNPIFASAPTTGENLERMRLHR